MKTAVKVAVRVKPWSSELEVDGRSIRVCDREFSFDFVFGESTDTRHVFREAVEPMLEAVFQGVNVTIFAYGQTGSGKTYTMSRVIRLTLESLFARLPSLVWSYVELYNEVIRDLLTERTLELRESSKGPTMVGVTEIRATSADAVLALLSQAKRTTESTAANRTSSRSHAILQVTIGKSKLSMIDLAGSERAADTENRGARLTEGAMINRSLLALGNVINALPKKKYVNFRDSKLTRLLKESLGGNCRTLMLAHVNDHVEETINTLKYASRARAITNSVKENISTLKTRIRKRDDVVKKLNLEIQLRDNLIKKLVNQLHSPRPLSALESPRLNNTLADIMKNHRKLPPKSARPRRDTTLPRLAVRPPRRRQPPLRWRR